MTTLFISFKVFQVMPRCSTLANITVVLLQIAPGEYRDTDASIYYSGKTRRKAF